MLRQPFNSEERILNNEINALCFENRLWYVPTGRLLRPMNSDNGMISQVWLEDGDNFCPNLGGVCSYLSDTQLIFPSRVSRLATYSQFFLQHFQCCIALSMAVTTRQEDRARRRGRLVGRVCLTITVLRLFRGPRWQRGE